ncbi:Aste57867_12252 [Aphanomyces stellatus]|uniref:Aste57867_12252 protein n=1 Tax=Aphanomyces stellatus TaxID=120398 RepID=A0A485KWF9_9STRA|nr:hypothetical protein As57867_012207 [Aphanomyces stellatus]VFT89105.1 Aste57867_12252 [Aphanomyces stellatus]
MRAFAVVSTVLVAAVAGQDLKQCNSAKVALAAVPSFSTPEAQQCGAEALGGQPVQIVFMTTATSDAVIAKMAQTPSCTSWYTILSSSFSTFKPCMYLGQSIQAFSALSLTEFLNLNNKQIQNFDPTRTEDPALAASDVEDEPSTTTVAPTTEPDVPLDTTALAADSSSNMTANATAATTATVVTTPAPTSNQLRTSSAATLAVSTAIFSVVCAAIVA